MEAGRASLVEVRQAVEDPAVLATQRNCARRALRAEAVAEQPAAERTVGAH